MVAQIMPFFIATLILLGLHPAVTCARDSVTWMEAIAPPFFIHEGQNKGQGYEDVITRILIQNLPEYNHDRITANLSRHYYTFKQGQKVCNVGMYKTPEREQFLYFSIPSFFTLPTVLIIKKNRLADFGESDTVQLKSLLASGKIVIGTAKNRSYGKYVDEILDTYKDQGNIYIFEGEELSGNFFQMLKLGRVDALISLPEEAVYQAEQLGMKNEIIPLTIAENQLGYESWFGYVACSKTPWGKELIKKINRILIEQRPTEQYQAAYERWLDKSSLKTYRNLYKNIFLQVTTSAEND